MKHSKDNRELPDVGVDVRSRGSRMLCSLRVVSVSSEHFLGRRYAFVDRVCEFPERYVIECGSGAEILQSSRSTRASSP
jgi:hypothetical protein